MLGSKSGALNKVRRFEKVPTAAELACDWCFDNGVNWDSGDSFVEKTTLDEVCALGGNGLASRERVFCVMDNKVIPTVDVNE
jgi:hypothetical protein